MHASLGQRSLFDEAEAVSPVRPSKDSTCVPNLSPKAKKYLAALGIEEGDDYPERAGALFFHIVAILHSPHYGAENASALRSDFPRIPLPSSRFRLDKSAELGKLLAALMDEEGDVPGVTSGVIFERYADLAELKTTNSDFRITARWGRSAGGAVMPGRGKLNKRSDAVDVYLNEESFWANIPIGVWEYNMGGYQVLKKWLSYREFSILERPLHLSEVFEFTNKVRRIAAMLRLEIHLDENYRAVKSATYPD